MTRPYTTEQIANLIKSEHCTLLAPYINNQTALIYKCEICGAKNYSRLFRVKEAIAVGEPICKQCRQNRHTIKRLETKLKKLLHEDKKIVKLTKQNVYVECDHCHRIKPINRKSFLTTGYLKRHQDVCCGVCGNKLGRKDPNQYVKEFKKADVNNEYQLLTPYVNSSTKVRVKHLKCDNTYLVSPGEFTRHGRRCPYCAGHVFNKKDYDQRQKKWELKKEKAISVGTIVFNPKPQKELWKSVNPVLNCPAYEVSNIGRVRKKDTHQIISIRLNRQTKYMIVSLQTKDHKPKTISVHRLVALTWVPGNEKNNPHIYANHLNEDRMDNWCTNLAWCDDKKNSNYGSAQKELSNSLRNRVYTKVEQWNADHTELLNTFNSIRQASIGSGVGRSVIKRIANDHQLKGSPYDWEIIK